jgi:surface antigen
VQTLYHHLKIPLALLLALLLLASCAPVRAGKKQARPAEKNNTGKFHKQALGHDLEISLRKGGKSNDLALLIQKKMDRYDREQSNHVFERGLSGHTSSWTNPDQGNQYLITPLPAYQTIGKSVCRKAQIEAMLSGGEQLTMTSKACRARNGQWRISQEK